MNRFDMPPEVTGFGSPIPPKVVKAAPPPAETWKPYTTPGFEINGIGQLRTTDGPVSRPEPPLAALPKPALEALKGETGRWMSGADGCQSFGTYDGATMKDVGPYVGVDFAAEYDAEYADATVISRHVAELNGWAGIHDPMLGTAIRGDVALQGSFGHFEAMAQSPAMKAISDMRDALTKQMYEIAAKQVSVRQYVKTPLQRLMTGNWERDPYTRIHDEHRAAGQTSVPGCMCDGCVASRKYGQ